VLEEARAKGEELPRGRKVPPPAAGTAPLAIASITAVLRDLLANELIRYSSVTRLGDVNVSVLPPDRITVGSDEPNQLNLFMYRVTPHSTLQDVRGRPPEGPQRRGRLALNLHYLVTAYGAHEFHSDILLGCAVHLLNGTPVLTRDAIRDALQPANGRDSGSSSPGRAALASWDADILKEIKITPLFMTFEDLSKLWSVLQARYRPSVTYEVSAVSIGSV